MYFETARALIASIPIVDKVGECVTFSLLELAKVHRPGMVSPPARSPGENSQAQLPAAIGGVPQGTTAGRPGGRRFAAGRLVLVT